MPTNEEERTRAFDPVESPEDVRLGYIELGLSKYQTQFGERLGTWEYALRYKPQLLTYVPNAEEVRLWADAVFDAYVLLFAETLNLPDPQPTESF